MHQKAYKGGSRRLARKPKKPQHPYLAIAAYPSVAGMPAEPLRGEYKDIVKLDLGYNYPVTEPPAEYLDRLRGAHALPPPEVFQGRAQDNPEVFKIAIKCSIPENLLTEEFRIQGIDHVIGVGEGFRVKEARSIAKLDVVERLYRMMKEPSEYLSSKMKESTATKKSAFLPVALADNVRTKINDACRLLNNTEAFSFTTGSDQGPSGSKRRSGDRFPLKFRTLPDALVKGMKPPTREASKLPITALFGNLIECIDKHNVTILSAATGSGKTTQLPQYILDAYGQAKEYFMHPPSILVTQPRRIAAKSVAQRVAAERDAMLAGSGRAVGYTVRFDSKLASQTDDGSIMFCTAGILLRRLQREPDLQSISHLILDEVHERDVFTDILLLVVKSLLKRRPDLRVILMSATMDSEKFVRYFENEGYTVGRVLDIEGTNHPVTKHYLDDLMQKKINMPNLGAMSYQTQNYVRTEMESVIDKQAASSLIIKEPPLQEIPFDLMAALIEDIVESKPEGAILVFLPGWDEITELQTILNGRLETGQVEIHLLHSTSPIGSADAAFRRPPPGVCKIILATNIAESSVTIPDVVYVLDSGKQKVMHYDQKLRMNVLEPCWISKANLRQRLGRAGRCQPGSYYAFYSRKRAESLPDQTLPELLRLGLDEVCLNLKAMGFTEPSADLLATAVDPPEKIAVRNAIDRLKKLGAIDNDELLTPLGTALSNIPIHPAMGKMLITAHIMGCLGPVLTTVALLGQKIFRPTRLPTEKYDLHAFYARFAAGSTSDHLLLHKIYSTWKRNNNNLGPELQAFEPLFSRPAIRRLDEARSQIHRELKSSLGFPASHDPESNSDNEALVRFVLTSGFYPDVAMAKKKAKNVVEMKMIRGAMLASSSVNHVLGTGSIQSSLELRGQRKDPLGLLRRRDEQRAVFYIYEELIDIGHKLVTKTTAIDPLYLFLFSPSTRLVEYKDARGTQFKQMLVDGWIPFRAEPSINHRDLLRLAELRLHWNDFVQFLIHKHLRGESLNEVESKCATKIKDAILALAAAADEKRNFSYDTSRPADEVDEEPQPYDSESTVTKALIN